MKKTIISLLAINFLSAVALAAGDPPQTLGASDAKATVENYKAVLNLGCPGSQNPTSGLVTGGASPFGGSQTIAIEFDGGAKVSIVSSWSGDEKQASSSSVTVKCALK